MGLDKMNFWLAPKTSRGLIQNSPEIQKNVGWPKNICVGSA
jgi:hypothetical protein